jgi:large-conductance mechanosensitive channel
MDEINHGVGQLKQFIIDNNIVGTSAGVCIALAVKDGIQSLIGDVIVPSFVSLLKTLHIPGLAKYLPTGKQLNVGNFIKQLITFILIIIISFMFVKFAFGYLLGIDKPKQKTKESFSIPVTNSANAPSKS